MQLTFDVRDPLGGQAFYWQGNVTAPVGLSNWGYSDTVSEPNGVYTFDAGADYQGRVTVDSASYQVPSIVFIPLVIR